MGNLEEKVTAAETGYEMDAELKQIMGSRYKDMSDKFTPEAQQKRRNNRRRITWYIAIFCLSACRFLLWGFAEGMVNPLVAYFGSLACMICLGYNIGVCVCHNKGWRGA